MISQRKYSVRSRKSRVSQKVRVLSAVVSLIPITSNDELAAASNYDIDPAMAQESTELTAEFGGAYVAKACNAARQCFGNVLELGSKVKPIGKKLKSYYDMIERAVIGGSPVEGKAIGNRLCTPYGCPQPGVKAVQGASKPVQNFVVPATAQRQAGSQPTATRVSSVGQNDSTKDVSKPAATCAVPATSQVPIDRSAKASPQLAKKAPTERPPTTEEIEMRLSALRDGAPPKVPAPKTKKTYAQRVAERREKREMAAKNFAARVEAKKRGLKNLRKQLDDAVKRSLELNEAYMKLHGHY